MLLQRALTHKTYMQRRLIVRFIRASIARVGALTVLFATTGLVVSAQTATFKWSDELCDYSGTYDAKKYTSKQIGDTFKLVQMRGIPFEFQATVWNYSELDALRVEDLEKEYKAKRAEVAALDLVKSPFWEKVRQSKLKEMDQVYRLSLVTARAYREPQVLRTYEGADSCKLKYAEPIIAGSDSLLTIWREVNKESQSKNSDPARLQRKFEEQFASADRLKFALVETMAFGWWNCANEYIEYEPTDADGSRDREFRKLFVRVRTIACSEP